MFFDEDMLLDLRLNIMDKYVDKFVITEATYMHNGSKKKLNFDINKFKKFKDKITYIVVDQPPPAIIDVYEKDDKEKRNNREDKFNRTIKCIHEAYLSIRRNQSGYT